MRKGGGRPRGNLRTIEERPPMNERITSESVRVVLPPETGVGKDVPVGVMPLSEALAMAEEKSVDLIVINEKADPPVCKLMEFTKWNFMKNKKAKEQAKTAKSTEVKELHFSYKIGGGDLEVRQKLALKFLKGGNRVKLVVMFRGWREQAHFDMGFKLLEKFSQNEQIVEWGVPEGTPKRDGKILSQMLSVRAERMRQETDRIKAKEKELKRLKKLAEKGGGAEKKAAENAQKEVDRMHEVEEEEGGESHGGEEEDEKALEKLNEEAMVLMEGEEEGEEARRDEEGEEAKSEETNAEESNS
jgi:translation initiation factor IF-3